MTEFVTKKGYDAKVVTQPCRQGACNKIMIRFEDGWRTVLSVIGTKNTSHEALIRRIREHY